MFQHSYTVHTSGRQKHDTSGLPNSSLIGACFRFLSFYSETVKKAEGIITHEMKPL